MFPETPQDNQPPRYPDLHRDRYACTDSPTVDALVWHTLVQQSYVNSYLHVHVPTHARIYTPARAHTCAGAPTYIQSREWTGQRHLVPVRALRHPYDS